MNRRTNIGEWIRLSRDLWSNPKIVRLAHELGGQLDLPLSAPDKMRTTYLVHMVIGALSKLWLVLNRHAVEADDGTADAIVRDIVTDNYLDEVADMAGLQRALIAVGWVSYDAKARQLRLVNYLEFNDLHKGSKRVGRRGDSDSKEAQRKRLARAKASGQGPDNAPGQAPDNGADKPRTSADNSAEKESETEPKLKNKDKNLLDGGQAADTASQGDELKRVIDNLRPDSWGAAPHWSHDDEQALMRARQVVGMLGYSRVDLGGRSQSDLLVWWLGWTARQARKDGNEDKSRYAVTSKRAGFIEGIASYIGRAKEDWLRCGKPRLGAPPPEPAKPKPAGPESRPTPPPGTGNPEPPEPPTMSFRDQVALPESLADSATGRSPVMTPKCSHPPGEWCVSCDPNAGPRKFAQRFANHST